ncbi:MAG TPA: DUF1002 domain-containing protein [Thermomicrobiales bacterium]|nr:DUF1002 domain-containing protein [Thermomicrobiales bacterium]
MFLPKPRSGSSNSDNAEACLIRHVRRVLVIITVAVLAVTVMSPGAGALQEDPDRVITIGESNSPEQREQLLEIFDADENDRVITITVAQTADAMEGIFDLSGIETAYSSTALTCRDLGEGLQVTTRNIQQITPGLYAMALVTAGIGDADLTVAAPDGLGAVRGQTALAGVFETWDIAPCESGNTSAARQRLALEQLTLTSEIGDLVFGGVPAATELVLEMQRQIVINNITDRAAIEGILEEQEAALGVTVPDPQRGELLDLMTRLAKADIDWSTFASGWTIETNAENTRITMRGEGIAILRAQQTATAEAGAALTATAASEQALTATVEAGLAMTATARARSAKTATAEAGAALTATAQASSARTATANALATRDAAALATANARATLDAVAALTATAVAIPTSTPIPPEAVSGEVLSNEGGQLTVRPPGTAAALTFPVGPDATITRSGESAPLEAIAEGDTVQLTVDGSSRAVTALSATPAPPRRDFPTTGVGFMLLALGLLGVVWWFIAIKRDRREPFVLKRTAT